MPAENCTAPSCLAVGYEIEKGLRAVYPQDLSELEREFRNMRFQNLGIAQIVLPRVVILQLELSL